VQLEHAAILDISTAGARPTCTLYFFTVPEREILIELLHPPKKIEKETNGQKQ
jgi:hypothetical protein